MGRVEGARRSLRWVFFGALFKAVEDSYHYPQVGSAKGAPLYQLLGQRPALPKAGIEWTFGPQQNQPEQGFGVPTKRISLPGACTPLSLLVELKSGSEF